MIQWSLRMTVNLLRLCVTTTLLSHHMGKSLMYVHSYSGKPVLINIFLFFMP